MPSQPPPVEEAALPFIEKMGSVLFNAGMPRMPARVFAATLAANSGSLTAAELSGVLKISPAAVSGAVRYLEQVGMVQRGRTPGDRRDYFTIGNDFWYESVIRQEDKVFTELSKVLVEGMDAVGADSEAGRRLAETRDFFDFLATQLPLLIEQWHRQRLSEGRATGS
ncbi:MarR family transcriptional regulator [Amycolatopsis acidicola]|uniref:MarR family transcriptional regulator n=1 Tax=Amycolatopsis acidicola TaxID=2596893 RepID=A0A5N0VFU9_9PSEU|nr:MarR family transcriptional regulator [Amycolatopsis acidicola]KAA9164995.1 MarR family transcriptional regulator [Amycolatopsis acidicola]